MTHDDRIQRDLDAAVDDRFDLIVIGGGIYGVCVALEAARRKLRPLLIERDDFGGATSWNSLRIIHGGLRYLQHLDFARFGESVRERRFFGHTVPGFVEPLPCLMPLYNEGLRRTSTFAAALRLCDVLGRDADLPGGRMLSSIEVACLFPSVRHQGLRGGGMWYDLRLTEPQRVLIELLRAAVARGAMALNYVAARDLIADGSRVGGVVASDELTGRTVRFGAPVVVNCAGPWCRSVALRLHRDLPDLFRPQIAFNALLDRPPVAGAAVAVAPRRPGARTYFLVPWQDRILAGTYHGPWRGSARIEPTDAQLDAFLADLSDAVPRLSLRRDDIVRLYCGLLPAQADDSPTMAHRPLMIHHANCDGPRGLWSVSGVKYTTARLVAQRLITTIFPSTDLPAALPDLSRRTIDARAIIDDESVVHLDDLVLRRTNWADDPRAGAAAAQNTIELFRWDADRRQRELVRLEQQLDAAVPGRHVSFNLAAENQTCLNPQVH